MSHYVERYCGKHGEWDEDVDVPSDCPACTEEAKRNIAENTLKKESEQREVEQLKARLKEAEACIRDAVDGVGIDREGNTEDWEYKHASVISSIKENK